MKKTLLIASAIAVGLAFAQPSFAADTAAAAAKGTVAEKRAEKKAAKFAESKKKHLERLNERIAHLQKKQSCVSVAATFDALHACKLGSGE